MATFVAQTDVGRPTCPICLGIFNVPRQLPCAHSFCHSCLQSYITSKAAEHDDKRYIECPLCRQPTGHFKQNQPTSDWATLFPVDIVLQSTLPTKSKGDRLCDVCHSQDVTATGFCAVCKEAMCPNCLGVHGKLKMTKFHTILTNEDFMKSAEGFTCFQQENEDKILFCDDHKMAYCGFCFLESHKTYSNMRKLNEELPALLSEQQTSQIVEELKKLETHLETFINMKESNMNDLESQVKGLADQIREMRRKINTALDELEMKVEEGRRMHKEVVIRTQEEKHQCLSLLHTIRNSLILCETVYKYGCDIQKYLTSEKIKSQLPLYCSQVREKYERIDTLTLQVKFTPLLESILLLSSDVGKLVTLTGSTLYASALRKPTKKSQLSKVERFNVNINRYPCFTGVTFLSIGRIMIVDYINCQCILLNKLHEVITAYKMIEKPLDVCVFGDEEVAVLAFSENKIPVLSVRDNVVSPVRTITTKYKCMGITACGKGEIVVVGDCGNNKCCWSLIRDGIEVSYSDQFDTKSGHVRHIALNNSKTRVYVTEFDQCSLHCFSMEGKMQYTYKPGNLKEPFGVAVDREDNIYVVGRDSCNIHQLSSDGCTLQIINTGMYRPRAISFDNSRNTFIITDQFGCKAIHIYHMK